MGKKATRSGRWREKLPQNPIAGLLASDIAALLHWVRCDLLDEDAGPVENLWELPEALKLLRKQQPTGAWRYPGKNRDLCPETKYDLLETFRILGQLVDKFGFDRRHPAVERAAEYLLTCQTEEGDIRGILGTQYMPYYHGVIVELLVRAGYSDDSRIEKALDWLLGMRQDDGGWLVPLQAVPAKAKTRELWSAPPIPPDRALPFSHLATGMILRALAAHPQYRQRDETQSAAERLKSRFFQADKYNDRRAPAYWTKFQFPFWWPNILTALDSLSLMGFAPSDADVQRAVQWFLDNQQENGLWKTGYEQANRQEMSTRERETMEWVGLAVCRVFKRLDEPGDSTLGAYPSR